MPDRYLQRASDALREARMRRQSEASPAANKEPKNEKSENVDLTYLYEMELESIEDYRKYIETERDPEVITLFESYVKEEEEHAKGVKSLIDKKYGRTQKKGEPAGE